jgi:hypothetical protein
MSARARAAAPRVDPARLGEGEGSSRQPCWAYFDGYLVMADGRLPAFAEATCGSLGCTTSSASAETTTQTT